jgi:hypothetical protein
MRMRTRKLIGAALLLLLALGWPLVGTAIFYAHLVALPGYAQFLAVAALGLAWVLPALPLIRWMQRPDRTGA